MKLSGQSIHRIFKYRTKFKAFLGIMMMIIFFSGNFINTKIGIKGFLSFLYIKSKLNV